MRHKLRNWAPLWLAGVIALTTAVGLAFSPANAQDSGGTLRNAVTAKVKLPAGSAATPTSGSGQYYIEFRSRYAWDYGHTYLIHGRVGERPTKDSVAGLSPVGDDPTSWVIGHYVPVPAETGWTDGDLEDKYTSARYRVLMDKEKYDRVVAYIKELQGRSHVWSAELYNCNAFVGDVAKFMGLKVPKSSLIYPRIFVNNMRKINMNPDAADTLVSDNVKEMSSPTRDGRAMINSGVYTAEKAQAEVRKPSSTPTPTVTIGPLHTTSRTDSVTASGTSSQ
jgi:hypothetical protein